MGIYLLHHCQFACHSLSDCQSLSQFVNPPLDQSEVVGATEVTAMQASYKTTSISNIAVHQTEIKMTFFLLISSQDAASLE